MQSPFAKIKATTESSIMLEEIGEKSPQYSISPEPKGPLLWSLLFSSPHRFLMRFRPGNRDGYNKLNSVVIELHGVQNY